MIKHLLLFLAILTASSVASTPNQQGLINLSKTNPLFIDDTFVPNIPPPPKLNSATIEKELAVLKQQSKKQDSSNILSANQEQTTSVELLVLSAKASAIEKPQTCKLIAIALHDSAILVARYQIAHPFPTPSDLDKSIVSVVDTRPFGAYPSLHACEILLAIKILQQCGNLPENSFSDYRIKFYRNRIIAGCEWPSAITGGEIMAESIFENLKQNPKYAELLEVARAEWH